MRDPFWRAAWDAVEPLLRPGDRLLLPAAEWPAACCRVETYRDRIEPGNATVLLLHKGKIGGIRKATLRHLMVVWHCVFANEVFVCLARWPDRAPPVETEGHLGRVRQYLGSRGLKRIRNTVFFVHLPKTAGTSVWNFLSERVASSVYYDTLESFLYNPPQRGEYDLVGGHVPLPLMAPYIGAEDRVVGLLREPTARFRSAFLHSRRADEDPASFSPIMQAMREQPLGRFLRNRNGQMELRQQLLMLGHDLSGRYSAQRDEAIFQNAVGWLSDPRSLFRAVAEIEDFMVVVCGLFRIAPPDGVMPAANGSGRPSKDHLTEFEALRAAIDAGNKLERELYERLGGVLDGAKGRHPV